MEISSADFEENLSLQQFSGNGLMMKLKLTGNYNANEDKCFFDKISGHINMHTKKLVFEGMRLNFSGGKIPIFPILTTLGFDRTRIEDDTVFQFDQWCPNATELVFSDSHFHNDDVLKSFYSAEKVYPQIKSLDFHFKSDDISKEWLEGVNKKFPQLENLRLQLESDEVFPKADSRCNIPYQPLYFKNLKKLTVFLFGTDPLGYELECMFNFLAISNEKLKELTINGMDVNENWYQWIQGCKKLSKLHIDCSYFVEDDLNDLKEMSMLREVKIEVKKFDWGHKELFDFIRKHPKLKLIDIDSNRKNTRLKYDDTFKKMFNDLIEERGKFTIKVMYHEGGRKMKISEKGFNETEEYEVSSSEEDDFFGDHDDDIDEDTESSA